LVSTTRKNPAKVAAGYAAAAKRWGVFRFADISDFPPDERAAIHAAIEARRAARQAREAAKAAKDGQTQ